jgi:predicted  nucleic acid-binding Zn-ribbon protein
MIETLRHIMTPRPLAEGMSEETIESVAIAGAAAIQHLIAERDTLRDRVNTQQRELVTLSAANEELRCRLGLIRQQYLELGSRILAQLEQFDRVTREAIQDNQAAVSTPQDEANLIALAHRLKPNSGPGQP